MDKLALQKKDTEHRSKELYEQIKDKKSCIIFSAGSYGSNLQIMLKQCFHKNVEVFCDNSSEKKGKYINGVIILSPSEAVANIRMQST